MKNNNAFELTNYPNIEKAFIHWLKENRYIIRKIFDSDLGKCDLILKDADIIEIKRA